MSITRRRFLKTSAGAGATVAGARFFKGPVVGAAPPDSPPDERVVPMPTGEWMSPSSGTAYRAYRSKYAKSADATTWVQIDLGEKRAIDSVKVYPANDRFVPRASRSASKLRVRGSPNSTSRSRSRTILTPTFPTPRAPFNSIRRRASSAATYA